MIRKLFKLAFAALLTAGALSVNAASVELKDTSGSPFSGSSCTYSSVAFAANGTMTVTCSGGGSLTPQTITFTSVPTTIPISGSGTVSATGGASGSPVTFSTTSSACTVSSSGTILGSANGACNIIANQAAAGSYAAAAPASQTWSIGTGVGSDPCAGVPVPSRIIDFNIATGAGGGAAFVSPDSAFGNYAVAAYRFTTEADKYGTGDISFEDLTGEGTFSGKLVAISTCPGDFTGIGVTPGTMNACYANNMSASGGINYSVASATEYRLCRLQTNKQYYFNIQSSVSGSAMKFIFVSHRATGTSP